MGTIFKEITLLFSFQSPYYRKEFVLLRVGYFFLTYEIEFELFLLVLENSVLPMG